MNVVIHPVHFDASTQLVEFINRKLTKLETFFDRIVETEVFLKLESRQNVKQKVVEVKVHVPGKVLFVTKTAKTFEQSTDLAFQTLAGQLKKQKERVREY
jgi:putative sigma-54 modulation protein